jgi:hypothetical protein
LPQQSCNFSGKSTGITRLVFVAALCEQGQLRSRRTATSDDFSTMVYLIYAAQHLSVRACSVQCVLKRQTVGMAPPNEVSHPGKKATSRQR